MTGPSKSLSRRQVRDFDRLAIEQWGVAGVVLMENAGRGATDAIEGFLGGVSGKKIAIVAGVGNNGGDGFVIARHLYLRGACTAVFIVGKTEKMTPDAATNFSILKPLEIDVHPCADEELSNLSEKLRGFELIVDALGGTGISGPLRGDLAIAVEQINAAGRPVVAIDIPTGLDCDTSDAPGPAVKASLTVTFVARKIGFDAPGASDYTGKIIVADIGVPLNTAAGEGNE
ncbi:MAG: NAD(P)H-hydrate epimerase [Planctomycetota bacterium]|nr:NAD(P)H-hydrate epimerase [Planctomycetota bacterium]